ncbi:MAG: hypothetical protein ACRELG_25720 [Gemmataceae bacterium]
MPKPKQHQEKADHNRAFLNTLTDDTYHDWKAIVAFYVAVHLVEKLRAYEGDHSDNHEERDRAVRRDHGRIYNAYHQLFNASLIARYKSRRAFHISAADVQGKLIDTYLAEIERYVAAETVARTGGAPPSSSP